MNNQLTPTGPQPYDYFSGTTRMDFEGKDPTDGFPLYYLQTAGYGAEPLTFHTREGVLQRPASRMHGYDMGSVPRKCCLQGVVSPNCWHRAFAMHDPGFVTHGWWESTDGINWKFVLKTEHQVNVMLVRWMRADGCGADEADIAFEGVALGGGELWDSHKGPFPSLEFINDVPATTGDVP